MRPLAYSELGKRKGIDGDEKTPQGDDVGPQGGQSRRVTHSAELLLDFLGDPISRKIVTSPIGCGKTIDEIAREQGIPVSTCYRKVKALVEGGLMVVERNILTRDGKKYAVYRTTFDHVIVTMNQGVLTAAASVNPDVAEKLDYLRTTARWTG